MEHLQFRKEEQVNLQRTRQVNIILNMQQRSTFAIYQVKKRELQSRKWFRQLSSLWEVHFHWQCRVLLSGLHSQHPSPRKHIKHLLTKRWWPAPSAVTPLLGSCTSIRAMMQSPQTVIFFPCRNWGIWHRAARSCQWTSCSLSLNMLHTRERGTVALVIQRRGSGHKAACPVVQVHE